MRPDLIPHSPSRRGRDGFTLIELVIIVVVMGILAMIALPRFAAANARHRADAAAERIVSDLALAARYARASSQDCTVEFIAGTSSYTIDGVPHPDFPGGGTTYEVRLDRDPYAVAVQTVDFDGDRAVIFDGYGHPDSGGTVEIRIADNQREIILDGETGIASVQ